MSKEIISELTPEQEAQFDVYAERWTKIGLDTAPADREKAAELVKAIYKQEGLEEPEIEWFDSPIAGARSLRERGVENPPRAAIYGQHAAGRCSYLAYMREVLGLVEETEDAKHHIELAKCCGWWYAFEGLAVLTDKPDRVCTDEQGDLHATDGPALRYRDGEAIYAVHGVVVPADIVEHSEKITMRRIIDERNVEIRRVMTDLAPWDRLSREAKVLDEDKDGNEAKRRLLRIDIPDDEAVILVEVRDGTVVRGERRKYYLRVPPTIGTCAEAVAWTFEVAAKDYQPKIET